MDDHARRVGLEATGFNDRSRRAVEKLVVHIARKRLSQIEQIADGSEPFLLPSEASASHSPTGLSNASSTLPRR